jgi:hypothetical protein
MSGGPASRRTPRERIRESMMIEQLPRTRPLETPKADRLVAEPFLHHGDERIYNTLTERFLAAGEPGFRELRDLLRGELPPQAIPEGVRAELFAEGWLVESAPDLATRFRLKYVSLEASTVCNQACYFCPVSVDRRQDHVMTMEFYEQIVAQLAAHKDTIDGVSMIHYNEPTADKRFVDQVRLLSATACRPRCSPTPPGSRHRKSTPSSRWADCATCRSTCRRSIGSATSATAAEITCRSC